MIQSGRKSSVQLATFCPEELPRPKAPRQLTEEEAEIWDTIVRGLPPKWFGSESWLILEQYCRLGTRARGIARAISDMEAQIGSDAYDAAAYDKLMTQELRVSASLIALATKMKITQQSLADSETAHKIKHPPLHHDVASSLWAGAADDQEPLRDAG